MDPETWEERMESEAVADWLDSMTLYDVGLYVSK